MSGFVARKARSLLNLARGPRAPGRDGPQAGALSTSRRACLDSSSAAPQLCWDMYTRICRPLVLVGALVSMACGHADDTEGAGEKALAQTAEEAALLTIALPAGKDVDQVGLAANGSAPPPPNSAPARTRAPSPPTRG